MAAKEQYLILTAKTELGRTKLDYHGERWLHRGTSGPRFATNPAAYFRALSLDGKKILFIQQQGDPDFDVSVR